MSDYEKALVASNDARSGRVIPPWRFGVLLIVTTLAMVICYRVGMADLGIGWVIVSAFVLGCVQEGMFGRFRMRRIA